ncbi:MAG TPA: TonB-dependent receptor plug domain-containing protein, partial [Sphingomonas sp.]|nr:TonB-dependent receptor plug domain-containing protein [Sphingomonas sp.]
MLTRKIVSRPMLCASAAPLALGLALAFAGQANAQTADPSPANTATSNAATATAGTPTDETGVKQETAGEEIVVTGSRIARPELQSVSPVAVIGSAAIQNQGITNIQDLAQKLPQIGIPGASRTNTNFATTGNGVSALNLRNLGDARTLVLVNGRRFVAGLAGTSTVDVNNIPTEMIDRVEVVTGGASAVYGSDAIAGVVNFILKDHFEGITARAQYGISSQGDNETYTASITGGTSFGTDKRGNVVANFTYAVDKGLRSRDRAISAQDCSFICGPSAYSTYAQQGRFQFMNGAGPSGNAGGYASNLFTFNPDNSVVLGFPTGYGFNRNSLRRIAVPLKRYLGTITSNYELTDHVKVYLEGTYGKTKSSSSIEPSPLASTDIGADYGIDNPFIPASIAAQIAARNSDGIASNDVNHIAFRRRQNEVFTRSNTNDRDTYRIAGGFRGDITDKWSFDVSGVYGVLKDHTETQDIDITKYAFALDAIRDSSGAIVCR